MANPSMAELLAALEKSTVPLDSQTTKLVSLLYGASGVGKTVEAMLLAQQITPEDEEIIFVDTGQGWVSLNNHPKLKRRTRRVIFEGHSQIETLVLAIKHKAGSFAKVGAIVFDEFSTVSKKDIHNVNKATGLGEYDASEFKQYNIATRRMEKIAWEILKVIEDCHVIMIAHEKVSTDQRTKIRTTGPSFMQEFGATLKENMHVVARCTADILHDQDGGDPRYERKMQVHPSKMVVAKSRVGGLQVIVSQEKFNSTVVEWLKSGGNLVEAVTEEAELPSERFIPSDADISDQVDFAGFEIEE